MREEIKPIRVPVTTYNIANKKYYVSDDGKKESTIKKDIEQYEKQVLQLNIRREKFDSIRKILPEGTTDGYNFYRSEENYFKFNSIEELYTLIDDQYGRDLEIDWNPSKVKFEKIRFNNVNLN